ncbi:MAG: hypothetical protein L3K08_02735, partial [Thermoplasmata archaeon]|nr:hypothetical protein [Thermoplasmata archaeon]
MANRSVPIERRRRGSILATGPALIAILVVLGPSVAAGSLPHTIRPAYAGSVTSYDSQYRTGCSQVHVAKYWGLSLGSGRGGAADSGRAQICTASGNSGSPPAGGFGTATQTGGVLITLPVYYQAPYSSVQGNVNWKANASESVTDNTNLTYTGACDHPLIAWHAYQSLYQWGYGVNASTGLSGFSSFNYTRNIDERQLVPEQISNITSGNPLPSPFNLNSTSALNETKDWGAVGSCLATSEVYFYVIATLQDVSTGTTVAQTGNTATSSNGAVFDVEETVENVTNWSCHSSVYWNGPMGTYVSNNPPCVSLNGTVTWDTINYGIVPSTTTWLKPILGILISPM